jgi:hypothetical protein
MADGIKFSSGMQYDAEPQAEARFMYDPDPGREDLPPRVISLADLIGKAPRSKGAFYMANTQRGSFNINTGSFEVEMKTVTIISMLDGQGALKSYTVLGNSVPWTSSRQDRIGRYLIVADLKESDLTATLWVGDYASLPGVTFSDPVLIGMFAYNSSWPAKNLFGLSACINDVTVDGKYIYVNPVSSSGMQYDANPAGTARFIYDPDPGSSNPEPRCISLDDLLKKVPKGMGAFYMCNTYRGSFNINTYDFLIELSYAASIIFSNGGGDIYRVSHGDTPWVSTEADHTGEYFIVADLNDDTKQATLWVGDRYSFPDATFSNPILIGGFIYDPGLESENLYGLSVCNGDVKVDGEYIYANPVPKTLYEATFIGPVRGAMNVDSVNKLVTVASGSEVFINGKPCPVSQLSTAWRKGASLNYDGTYVVYADISESEPEYNNITAVMYGSLYMPIGDAYVIGGFVFDGTSVTGINFKNDVFVDGAYIYGGEGRMSGKSARLIGGGGDNFLNISIVNKTIDLLRAGFAKSVYIDGDGTGYVLSYGSPTASWAWTGNGATGTYLIYADIVSQLSPANRLVVARTSDLLTYAPNGKLYALGAFSYINDSSGNRIVSLSINSVTPLVDGVKWTEEP